MNASPPWETYSEQAALALLGGNVDALHLVLDFARLSHFFDDLVDRDKAIEETRVHDAMWTSLVTLPLNPFYRAHEATLRPMIVTAILNWKAATDMERRGSKEELRLAHTLRYSLADLWLMCLVLTGGRDHALQNARRARLMCQNDTWANYSSEHPAKDST